MKHLMIGLAAGVFLYGPAGAGEASSLPAKKNPSAESSAEAGAAAPSAASSKSSAEAGAAAPSAASSKSSAEAGAAAPSAASSKSSAKAGAAAPSAASSKSSAEAGAAAPSSERKSLRQPADKSKAAAQGSASARRRLAGRFGDVSCHEHFQTKYNLGYVEFQIVPCEKNQQSCMSYSEIERNHCRDGQLFRRRCDLDREAGYFIEVIPCGSAGCHSDGGRCLQPPSEDLK